MQIRPLAIPDVLLLRPAAVMDQRGWVSVIYDEAAFTAAGIASRFTQDMIIYADKPGTVRGLRYQLAPKAQATLMRVLRGQAFAVAIDLRRPSPHFGRAVTQPLSYMDGASLYVPEGFATGWCSTAAATEMLVRTSVADDAGLVRGLNWRDPALGIDWPVKAADAIISVADIDQPMLADQPDLFD